MTFHFPFQNTYAAMPERFYARVKPTGVNSPSLIRVNRELACHLGLDPDWLASNDGVEVLAGKRVPEGALPIAMAYAGHQFGYFVPQLGDGRAILLGELIDRDAVRRDVQLKGAGRTPFSRGGDGRAALGPVLREYIVSEAMAALGIPTTRSLAAVLTGELVFRERPLPGAVLTRVASSHIRVGTFQFFAVRQDVEGVRLLAEHVIERHYPETADAENRYCALLDAVIEQQAALIARWLHVGFIHGVMNTDNISVAGETIDYGPCAFMDDYDPARVFSSIDHHGRYAYANQPPIATWNLARFAETLLPLLSDNQHQAVEQAQEALRAFGPKFETAYLSGMRRKLGLSTVADEDEKLIADLLDTMAKSRADYTLTFRRLIQAVSTTTDEDIGPLFEYRGAFESWLKQWRTRLANEPQSDGDRIARMKSINPAFIPRNHRVEEVIRAAIDSGNFSPFETLLEVLATPYDDQPDKIAYMAGPRPHEVVQQTFCGT